MMSVAGLIETVRENQVLLMREFGSMFQISELTGGDMKRALLVSVVVSLAVAFAGASAQADRHESPGAVNFAVGSSANQLKDGSDFGVPIIAHLGFEKRFDGSPFSVRFEANGFHTSNNAANSQTGEISRNRTRSVGLALIPVYSFSNGLTRPYVLAGAGFDHFSRRDYFGQINTPGFGPIPAGSTLRAANTVNFSIGAGILRRVGEGWYFTEIRGEAFTGEGFQRFRVPVTVGMRF
jgi:hypothetical protein